MSGRLYQVMVIVGGVAFTLLFLAVIVQLWAYFPPGNLDEFNRMYWAEHSATVSTQARAGAWALYYVMAVAQAWPLVFVLALGGVLTYVVWSRYQGEEIAAYLERMYVLEKQYDDTAKREEALLARWDKLLGDMDANFESSGDAWLVLSPDGRIRRWNKAAMAFAQRRHVGLESLEGQPVQDIWSAYLGSPLANAVYDAGKNKKNWHGEAHLASDNMHVLAWVLPMGDEIGVRVRDVSSRYQTEGVMRSSEALARALVEESIRPVVVVDVDWKYVYVSAKWQELFNLPLGRSLIGQSHTHVMPDFPPNLSQVMQQLSNGGLVGMDESKITLSGREEMLSWAVRPWRDADGALGGYILTAHNVTELVKLRAQIKQGHERENALAYSDALTGLPNRQLFNDRLNMALALAYRQLSKVALMFLDLDGFKGINDNLGHDYGDMLLRQVGERLKKVTRDTDTVARLGGDEFTIILNVREKNDAELVARKVLESLQTPFDLGGKEGRIGVSIGISMYPVDGSTAADLIKRADAAMYEAKNAGKNTYRFATKESIVLEIKK